MVRTLSFHFGFVTAWIDDERCEVDLGINVLHCDKASWFRHIEAPTVRFGVLALIVSGDNGLSA
jgi:hypothetical protein